MRNPRCAQTECQKVLPDRAVNYGDPFCSTRCAKAAYGVAALFQSMKDQPDRERSHKMPPLIINEASYKRLKRGKAA